MIVLAAISLETATPRTVNVRQAASHKSSHMVVPILLHTYLVSNLEILIIYDKVHVQLSNRAHVEYL